MLGTVHSFPSRYEVFKQHHGFIQRSIKIIYPRQDVHTPNCEWMFRTQEGFAKFENLLGSFFDSMLRDTESEQILSPEAFERTVRNGVRRDVRAEQILRIQVVER